MKDCHNENELALLNRLLEQLHQTDYRILGSIEIHIYKAGSQRVDKIERQYITASPPTPGLTPDPDSDPGLTSNPSPVSEGNFVGEGNLKGREKMPEVLRTEGAMALWGKVQEAGYVDAAYQPLLSRTQSAILADEMALRLGIKEKWKVFEALWQRQNMYKDYYRALGQKQSLKFRDALKGVFSGT